MLNKRLNLIARTISTIFIPPVNLFAVIVYIAFLLENNIGKQTSIIVISFVFTLFAPILYFILMLKQKKIVNKDATNKEERTIPYLFGILFLSLGLLALYLIQINQILLVFFIIQIVNSFLLIAVNYFWKISAHMIGFSSPVAFLFFFSGNQVIIPISLVLLIILGWSRYYLKCHSFSQILAGVIFGFGLTLLQLFIFLGK
jgi:membrane-associated phospholipid phosphatase